MPASSAATTAPASSSSGQHAGLGAEKVEGPDVFAGNDHGHGEYAADLVVQHGGAVRRPTTVLGVGQVGDEDRGALRDRVQAGPLAEE